MRNKIKVSEATGTVLDYLVTKCEGIDYYGPATQYLGEPYFNYSTDWSQGGPIVEREIFKLFRNVGRAFTAQVKVRVPYYSPTYDADIGRDEIISASGPTPLIAAMRCYVANKLGDEVEVPEELCPTVSSTNNAQNVLS